MGGESDGLAAGTTVTPMALPLPRFASIIMFRCSAVRRIAGSRNIEVYMQSFGGIDCGRVAISIFIIVSGAAVGEVSALWRLRKLPDVGK
jgi:hypothetical protein